MPSLTSDLFDSPVQISAMYSRLVIINITLLAERTLFYQLAFVNDTKKIIYSSNTGRIKIGSKMYILCMFVRIDVVWVERYIDHLASLEPCFYINSLHIRKLFMQI